MAAATDHTPRSPSYAYEDRDLHVEPPLTDTSTTATSLIHLERTFKTFRDDDDAEGLIQFLYTAYPENVKNRTFVLGGHDHRFHSLYAYVPAVGENGRPRKQLRLAPAYLRRMFKISKNNFALYADVRQLIANEPDTCPCQLLEGRLQEFRDHAQRIKNKEFDCKPDRCRDHANLDAILLKYSLNWKTALMKVNKRLGRVKTARSSSGSAAALKSGQITLPLHHSQLPLVSGAGVVKRRVCCHEYVVVERQCRAGDEPVTIARLCRECGASE